MEHHHQRSLRQPSITSWSKKWVRPQSGIYHSLGKLDEHQKIPTRPDLDTATYVLSQFPHPHQAESQIALIDSSTNQQVTYAQLQRSIHSLASGLYHALGVWKVDVVFVLSPNSLLHPTMCLVVFSIGAILTTTNPLNTESEIVKQVHDSRTKLAILAPKELHKLVPTGVPINLTSRKPNNDSLSIEEFIECSDHLEFPQPKLAQSDTVVILYTFGLLGQAKVLLVLLCMCEKWRF